MTFEAMIGIHLFFDVVSPHDYYEILCFTLFYWACPQFTLVYGCVIYLI